MEGNGQLRTYPIKGGQNGGGWGEFDDLDVFALSVDECLSSGDD